MYTVTQAAPLLNLTPRTVRAFIQRGMIAAAMTDGKWMIAAEEVERYNRERRKTGGQFGRVQSQETREKLRTIKLAHNPMKGRAHTPETRARISITSSQQPRGAASHAWKGGRVMDTAGYILIYAPTHPSAVNRYVCEHRLVMEQTLGRLLTPDEVVHHKNGVITDNRPENLEVMTAAEHSRFHRLNPHVKRQRGD